MSIFLNDWSDSGISGLMGDFKISKETLENTNILFASYTYEDYSGSAFVLFEEDNKFYEVNGSHCSCYGLEGQWEPEEINLTELKKRVDTHYCFEGYREELRDLLNTL